VPAGAGAPGAVEVALEHAAGDAHDFGGLGVAGGRGVRAPLVEDFGDVDDGLGAFGCAQDEVVVLRDGEGFVQAAQFAQELGAKADEVDDVGVFAQVFGREHGAADVLQRGCAIGGDEDFVGVEHVRVVLLHGFGNAPEGLRFEQIVMVEQDGEGAGAARERSVGCVRDAVVGVAQVQLDAAVPACVFLQHPAHVRLGGCVVGDAEFPVWIPLRLHRAQHGMQHGFGSVVGWHQNADARRRLHGRDGALGIRLDFGGKGFAVLLPPGERNALAQACQCTLEARDAAVAPRGAQLVQVGLEVGAVFGEVAQAAREQAEFAREFLQSGHGSVVSKKWCGSGRYAGVAGGWRPAR
jgi:hypothetical protein